VSHATEVFLWAALCFNPQGFDAYDPIHAKNYRIKAHYHNEIGFNITYGINCRIWGPGDKCEWWVLKYTKDPFQPLLPMDREVTCHDRDGKVKIYVEP
jgi:hypothetical protein